MKKKKKTKATSKPKVLVIDDELDLLNSFKQILREEGYSVTTVQNGFKGIEANKDENPDLIILDLKMPEMGGIETLRNIRKTDKDVVVVILTGYGDAETVRTAADLNVYEYISKPFNNDVIKKVIKEALSSRRA